MELRRMAYLSLLLDPYLCVSRMCLFKRQTIQTSIRHNSFERSHPPRQLYMHTYTSRSIFRDWTCNYAPNTGWRASNATFWMLLAGFDISTNTYPGPRQVV